MKKIGRTADGTIVVDRHNSHLHECIDAVLVEALKLVTTKGRQFIEEEVNLGRVIGWSTCVSTNPEDIIVYAQRPNRKGLTRFVMSRAPEPTSKAMVVLKKSDKPSEYILITAFAGSKAEVEPWDPRATDASVQFWKDKALIWDGQIIEGTVTKTCPW